MPVRVPLDVDLEDRLVYGLTPMRLAYAVLAGLAGMALWSAAALPVLLRAPMAVVALAAGAILAWGSLHGRQADEWLVDSVLFLWSTRRLRWAWPASPRSTDNEEDDFGEVLLGEAA